MDFKKSFLPALNQSKKNTGGAVDAEPSVLTANIVIDGNLICSGDVHLEGRISGDVNAQGLRLVAGAFVKGDLHCVVTTIATGSRVEGNVNATSLRIEGELLGDVVAETLHITDTAQVSGNISYHKIAIDSGAQLEGALKRMAEQKNAVEALPDSLIPQEEKSKKKSRKANET